VDISFDVLVLTDVKVAGVKHFSFIFDEERICCEKFAIPPVVGNLVLTFKSCFGILSSYTFSSRYKIMSSLLLERIMKEIK